MSAIARTERSPGSARDACRGRAACGRAAAYLSSFCDILSSFRDMSFSVEDMSFKQAASSFEEAASSRNKALVSSKPYEVTCLYKSHLCSILLTEIRA